MRARGWAARLAGIVLLTLAGRAAAQDTHLLIVAGLGGEPQYAESFRAWLSSLQAAAEKRMGIPRSRITYLSESPEKDPAQADGLAPCPQASPRCLRYSHSMDR